jgi:cation:H+ antiporter
VDIPVMALVALVCAPIFLSGREVSRMEAAALVGSYLAYLAYLLIMRT